VGTVRESGFASHEMARRSASLIATICTLLLATKTTSCALALGKNPRRRDRKADARTSGTLLPDWFLAMTAGMPCTGMPAGDSRARRAASVPGSPGRTCFSKAAAP